MVFNHISFHARMLIAEFSVSITHVWFDLPTFILRLFLIHVWFDQWTFILLMYVLRFLFNTSDLSISVLQFSWIGSDLVSEDLLFGFLLLMSDLSWSVFPRVFFFFMFYYIRNWSFITFSQQNSCMIYIWYNKAHNNKKCSQSSFCFLLWSFNELLSLNQCFSILKTHIHSILHYQKYDDQSECNKYTCIAVTFVCHFFVFWCKRKYFFHVIFINLSQFYSEMAWNCSWGNEWYSSCLPKLCLLFAQCNTLNV